jgi:hypothetical protein
MRTYVNAVVTSNSVFGFGQDCVVSLVNDSCAYAAQHLESRHAKRARAWARAPKRAWLMAAATSGLSRMTELTCLVITGPRRLRERLLSPDVVLA